MRLFLLLALTLLTLPTRASDLAITGAKIYPSPTDPPLVHASILIHDGRIVAVGPRIHIPRNTTVLDAKGLVVTAGFWNSHVHILLPGLLHAETRTPEELQSQLQEMLTRWGFTTVFDIASTFQNTNVLRRRIASGEVQGPRILTTGEPFWIGTPVYIRQFLETNHLDIPETHSVPQATADVATHLREGVDGIKIFANSVEADTILTMPLDMAQAITSEAHRAGKPVFAHVSNNAGIEVALKSGVDILAHTTPADQPWSPAFAERLADAHLALTPTLTLWEVEYKGASPAELDKGMNLAAGQLGAFAKAGGQVLFGTDVGYIQRFDTAEEFKWMARAGLTWQQVLASLTTNPAQRFGASSHTGRIAKGQDADLVLLNADPAQDPLAFSKVHTTLRAGKILYRQK